MPDGVKTTYEGFLRKVKTAGKRQTYCGSGPAERGEGGGGGGGGGETLARKGYLCFRYIKG